MATKLPVSVIVLQLADPPATIAVCRTPDDITDAPEGALVFGPNELGRALEDNPSPQEFSWILWAKAHGMSVLTTERTGDGKGVTPYAPGYDPKQPDGDDLDALLEKGKAET